MIPIHDIDDVLLARACRDRGATRPMGADAPPPELDSALGPVLAQAVHTSRASVLITDADLEEPGPTIVYANPAFEAMTGYRSADVVGRNPRFLQGPATDRSVLDRLRSDLEAGRGFEGEAVNYRDDGTPFVMSWRIAQVAGADGRATHYVAIQDDVTEDRMRTIQERLLVGDLQRSLLPEVPATVGHLDLAASYRPATPEFPVGGDWYDVVEHASGAVTLVVGDVAGHGADAVAAMGRLRWSVHALLAAGSPLPMVAAGVDDLTAGADTYATLAMVTVTATGQAEVITCGNPPVGIRRADGTAEALSTPNPMLGLAMFSEPLRSVEVQLRSGDEVALVTDGVFDGGRLADEDFDVTMRRWLGEASGTDLAARCDHLTAQGGGGDDAAVLVARLR